MLKPTTMRLLLLTSLCLIFTSSLLAQQPTLQLKESKRVITLDDEKGGNTSVEMRSIFTAAETKKVSTEWIISGEQGKDWEFTKGDQKSDIIEVNFKRVGNYSVSLNVTYAIKKTLRNIITKKIEVYYKLYNKVYTIL